MQKIILKFKEIAIIMYSGTFSPYFNLLTQFSSKDMQNSPDNRTRVEKIYKNGLFFSISSESSKLEIW